MATEHVTIPNVEIFRAGNYGDKGSYSEADLSTYAENYNSGSHEAPVTTDHRKSGPAYGWLIPKSVRAVGTRLFGDLSVIPEFAEILRRKLFKHRSIELYTEDMNIRAVTFLGAQPPHVKGMAELNFSATKSEPVFITFDEGAYTMLSPEDKDTIAAMISEVVAKAMGSKEPEVKVDMAEKTPEELAAAKSDAETKAKDEAAMAESKKAVAKMSEEVKSLKSDLAKFAAENARLAELAASERAKAEAKTFSEQHSEYLTPAAKRYAEALFSGLDSEESVDFSDAEGKEIKRSPRQLFSELVKSLPKHNLRNKTNRTAEFMATPDGSDDPQSVRLNARAEAIFNEGRKNGAEITFAEALQTAVKERN